MRRGEGQVGTPPPGHPELAFGLPHERLPVADAVAPHQLAGSRLVAQTEPGWYERLPRGDRHVPPYRSRYDDDTPGPSRARLAQLVRQVRLLVILVATLVLLQPGILYVLLTHR